MLDFFHTQNIFLNVIKMLDFFLTPNFLLNVIFFIDDLD